MHLMHRYTEFSGLLAKMSQLAREELLHFQQVVEILVERDIPYCRLGSSRYASGLRSHIRAGKAQTLTDILIIGAFIEARSCERFAGLVTCLDDEGDSRLAWFYLGLLKSEARHFQDYLELARIHSAADIDSRIDDFRLIEAELVTSADSRFRFHSGIPIR